MNEKLTPVLEALLNNAGLQAISDTAATALGNPFWISDLNARHLTVVSGNSEDENLLSENESGYVQDETLDYLNKNHIKEQINRSEEPLIFMAPGQTKHILSCASRITNVSVANVSTIEENHSFTKEDVEMIKVIAKIVSAEFQKSSFYKENKDMMYSYFLTDLLENRLLYEDTEKRLKKIGYQMKEYFYLITVELGNIEHRDILLNNINGQIKHILKDAIYCVYKSHSVFLVSRSKRFGNNDPTIERLASYLQDSNLKAAWSHDFHDISFTPHHYEQSKNAIQLGKLVAPDRFLYNYSTLVSHHAINIIKGVINYNDFCNGAVEKLLTFDQETHNTLTETLYCYLENNCNIVPTSKKLNLHPNTMRYRLEKIKEVTECDLSNGHQCFDLMFSLKMYYGGRS